MAAAADFGCILTGEEIDGFLAEVLKRKLNRLKRYWVRRDPSYILQRRYDQLPNQLDRDLLLVRWWQVAEGLHQGIFGVGLPSISEEDKQDRLGTIFGTMKTALLFFMLEFN
jgi:hypothetical protein